MFLFRATKNNMSIPKEYEDKIKKDGFNPVSPKLQEGYLKIIIPLADFFKSLNMNPNTLTTLGTIFTIVGAIFFALSYLRTGGLFIVFGAICDTMDGRIARDGGKKSKFGALYDSVMDRYSEFIMFFGIAVYFVRHESYWTSVAIFAAVGGSVMVSYVRARAEGLGLECSVGMMQRTERITYISVASVIGDLPIVHEVVLIIVIWIIAILANYTAIQRMVYIYKITRESEKSDLEIDKRVNK